MLGVEHGKHAGDPIARQAEFVRLRSLILIVIVIIVRRNTEGNHLAHRRVGELIVQPGRDPFRLRDRGDSLVGKLGQPAPDGDGVVGRQGLGPPHERHVEHHTPSVDMIECPVLLPFLDRQRPRPTVYVAHCLDVLPRIGEKALPFF